LLAPALLGIAWLVRSRSPIAANDNQAMEHPPAYSWVPAERADGVPSSQAG
jgi:hypothetical protein